MLTINGREKLKEKEDLRIISGLNAREDIMTSVSCKETLTTNSQRDTQGKTREINRQDKGKNIPTDRAVETVSKITALITGREAILT
jgi:predicted RNase H-like nuclease